MYDIKKIFASNIKRIRKSFNYTQEQFAEIIGMQWKSVVNFESARNLANSENLQKICNTLKIAPHELFLTVNNNEKNVIEKINLILKDMSKEKLEETYRVIAVLNDKSHFLE